MFFNVNFNDIQMVMDTDAEREKNEWQLFVALDLRNILLYNGVITIQ